MKQVIRYGIILACFVVGVLLVAGCSSDKGTEPPTLSKEAQLDSLSTYVSFEPTGDGNDIVSMMMGQLNPAFWDGIDSSDFYSTGGLLASKFPPSVSPAAATDTSLTFSYLLSGWWYIEYRQSWTSDLLSIVYDATYKDSVRFETAGGIAQVTPDDVNTYRIIQHGSISVIAKSYAQDDSVGVQMKSNIDATGLNSSDVTVNGDGSVALGVITASTQGSADLSVVMEINWEDVTLSNPGTQQACPTSGDISGDFTLGMDVQDATNHYQVNGDWNVGILFSGGGNTTVNVHSGDFQKSFTGNVCSK